MILCIRFDLNASAEDIYGKNVALRFPYLYVCFVFMAYLLMYSIQHYWVEEAETAGTAGAARARGKRKSCGECPCV